MVEIHGNKGIVSYLIAASYSFVRQKKTSLDLLSMLRREREMENALTVLSISLKTRVIFKYIPLTNFSFYSSPTKLITEPNNCRTLHDQKENDLTFQKTTLKM